jgi:hypothetical protein
VRDRIALQLRVVRFGEVLVGWFGEGEEASRRSLVEAADALLQAGTDAAGEVHQRAHAFAIHDRQQVLGLGEQGDLFAYRDAAAHVTGPGQVRVHVDHRKTRTFDARLRHVQHAARTEVLQPQVALAGVRLGLQRILAALDANRAGSAGRCAAEAAGLHQLLR